MSYLSVNLFFCGSINYYVHIKLFPLRTLASFNLPKTSPGVRLIGDPKLSKGVNVRGCLSFIFFFPQVQILLSVIASSCYHAETCSSVIFSVQFSCSYLMLKRG